MRREMRTAMHEWPLVLFTSLAIAGAGTLAVEPALLSTGAGSATLVRERAAWAAALTALGLAVSLGHLGKPRRLALASRRFGRSWLSTEVVLAALVVLAGAVLASCPAATAWQTAAAAGAALVAWLFLVSLGFVYRLRGQLAWPAIGAATPLLLGLSYGTVAHGAAAPETLGQVIVPAVVLLIADAAVVGIRWWRICHLQPWTVFSYPRVSRHRDLLFAGRLLLVNLAPAALLFASAPTLADLSLGIGLLIDRIAFYGLAAQHTTEAEVACVESLLSSVGETASSAGTGETLDC